MAPSSQDDMESQRRNLAVEQSEPGSRAEIQTAGEGSVGCVGVGGSLVCKLTWFYILLMLFNKHKTAKTMPDKNELPTHTHQNIRKDDTDRRQWQNIDYWQHQFHFSLHRLQSLLLKATRNAQLGQRCGEWNETDNPPASAYRLIQHCT